jgi:hypothetical protein
VKSTQAKRREHQYGRQRKGRKKKKRKKEKAIREEGANQKLKKKEREREIGKRLVHNMVGRGKWLGLPLLSVFSRVGMEGGGIEGD